MQCRECSVENATGAKFCTECGAALANRCPKCGQENVPRAKFCNECGAALSASTSAEKASPAPKSAEATAEGERRHLTVLFCDLVGSTEIASRLDPEQWHEIGSQYQRSAADAAKQLGGYVAKYLGDGLVVYFGYPEALEDAAERAVRAGLAMVATMAALNDRFARHNFKLSVRVGIHTGSVVVAQGGGNEADMFGDAPNIASRVQGVAAPDTVVITDAVQDLVSGLFAVEDRGAQLLKGIERPIQLYRVIGPGVARRRARGFSARKLTPFVGRDDELRLLLSRWQRARDGEGQLVLVTGEPGIGKSRLLEEFREHIKPDQHLWIECAGAQLFNNTPFHAVTQMLDQGLGWRGDEGNDERIGQLERALGAVGLKVDEALPLIADMLALPVPQKYPPLILSPDQRRKRLLAALAGWVLGATRLQPLVIAMEDLHWVDPSTLELMQLLIEQAATSPLLLIGTSRPEFRAPWPMRAHHAQIALNRLNDRQTREMVTDAVARMGLLNDVIDAVVKRTDGIPLFAEELARLMLEGDGRSGAREIPATLRDSLTARLDRLGRAKEVAQVGAVLGREFSYELLHAVSPLSEDELQSALTKLADAELIYVRGLPPAATYQFKHALIQDAAYEALLKSKRRELHTRVAKILTKQFSALAEAQPQLLARHWTDAGEAEPAIAAWTKAAKAADARSAFKEAEGGYRQAISMLGTLPESSERDVRELELMTPLVLVVSATRGWSAPETVEVSARAAALAEKGGNLPQLVIQTFGQFASVWTSGDVPRTVALADQLLDLAKREGSDLSLRCAHEAECWARWNSGDLTRAEEHFKAWKGICEASGYGQFPGETATTLGTAANVAWALGYADLARERIAMAMTYAQDTKNPYELGVAHMRAAPLFYSLTAPLAEAVAEQQLAMAQEHSFVNVINPLRVQLGWTRTQLGRIAEGVALIDEGIAGMVEVGARLQTPGALLRLAQAQALQGAVTDALVTIENAVRQNPDMAIVELEALALRGDLRLQLGSIELAEADFREVIALAQRSSAKAFELRAATSLARLLQARGKISDARDLLAPVYSWFTEGFDTRDLIEAKATLNGLSC